MTARSRPFHFRWHRRQDRIDIAPGFQAKNGAAVVEQIEFHIAPATDQLLLTIIIVPRRVEIAAHQVRIDFQKRAADVLRKGEVGIPVAAVMPVVEDAAELALLAMRQIKYSSHHFCIFVVATLFAAAGNRIAA